jgi:hypothetical protein
MAEIKSAKEWITHIAKTRGFATEETVQNIQADALRGAAWIAQAEAQGRDPELAQRLFAIFQGKADSLTLMRHG